MRACIISLAVLAAACGQPAPEREAEQPVAATPAAELSRTALVGTWSFDGSCASGDGMGLAADGSAFFDEWGQGTWRLDAQNRVVLDLRRQEMGVDEPDGGEPVTMTIQVAAPVGDTLQAQINTPGENPREVTARRCD